MNTHSRRTFLALAGASSLVATTAAARPGRSASSPLLSCTAPSMSTPEIVRVESDISFEQAYLDTTIPYHSNGIALSEAAIDHLDDDRLILFAEHILESHPGNIVFLADMREELFDARETEEATHEKMLIAMGGMESCTDETHMNFLDTEWVMESFNNHDNPQLAYVSMMVLLLEMENHQHQAGVELAEHPELREFCAEMVEDYEVTLADLKVVRGEIISRP